MKKDDSKKKSQKGEGINMTKFHSSKVRKNNSKGATWMTYGMDNSGDIHVFKGKKRLTNKGGQLFVDSKGKEADVFIQRDDDRQAFLDEVNDKDLKIGEYNQKKVVDEYTRG